MPTLVAFGAGNVGRGFVGDLFASAGWNVVFLDVAPTLVDTLHAEHSYTHCTVSNDAEITRTITGIDAVRSTDTAAVARLITDADLLSTSVGARVLPLIVPVLTQGVLARRRAGRGPVDMLLCENLHHASTVVRSLIADHLGGDTLEGDLGLAETSIGRMIPTAPPQDGASPTLIRVEPYRTLPYDAAALLGPEPEVGGLLPIRDVPFDFYADRKLFLHNMGHCACACLGDLLGHEYIWQAVADPRVRAVVRGAMGESALALARRYDTDPMPLMRHVDDLLARFGNRALADTVERVARDPQRKLAPEDRLLGAFRAAVECGAPRAHLSLALALGADRLARETGWDRESACAHVRSVIAEDARRAPCTAEVSSGAGRVDDVTLFEAQFRALAGGFDWAEQLRLLDSAAEE